MIDPLVAAADLGPDRTALEDATRRWTWRDLLGDARALAGCLDVEAGGRIALLAADTGGAVVAIHAVRLAGATLVPLNRRLTVVELLPLMTRSGVTHLLHDSVHQQVAMGLATSLAALQLVPCGSRSATTPRQTSSADEASLLVEDAAGALVFTSGTTGAPKGVLLTHGNLIGSALGWNTFLDARSDDHWLATLPLFHVAGLGVVLRSACSTALLTIHDRFDPTAVRAALSGGGVTHISVVPTQLSRLLDGGPVAAPHLRALLLGGAPIPKGLVQRAAAAGLPIVTTYGLTEAASGVTALAPGEAADHPNSAGMPLPGVLLRVVTDDGMGARPGSVGDILVSGPTVFAGYDGDPDATATVLRGGWLRTGDLGSLDADGRLTLMDRRDDLIISGGENISPAEVEAVLLAHPDVADAAVVGRADTTWGAVPVAAVVFRPGSSAVGTSAISAFARESLASYKVPVAIEVVPAIPRTASGKITRRNVARLIATAVTDEFVDRPDGARIHVRRCGSGPTLVLLHATLSNAQELDPLAVALAGRWSVLTIDRRSAGASSMPPNDILGPIDAQVHVDDIVAVLDVMAPTTSALVVGHSYGGCIGLELAARHPDRVAGAWLFEPPYLMILPDTTGGGPAALGERIRGIAQDQGLGAAALAFLETVNGPGVVRRLPPAMLAQFEREGRGAVADSALAGFQPTGLGDVVAPVEIGLGGRSRGPYAAVAAGLAARIPTIAIERFPTLGHGGPISKSGVIADAILTFAARIDRVAPLTLDPGGTP